jgi:hypothetical protein
MYSTRHMYDDEFVSENLTTPHPDSFDRWAAEMDDVTDVNLKSANAFWRGESVENRGYVRTRKSENFRDCWNISVEVTQHDAWNDHVLASASEQLVFTSDDKYGNRLVRFWIDRDRNITARIRYVKNEPHYLVEVFYNQRNESGRWLGQLVKTYKVHRTVTEEAELTVAKYVALEFAQAQANA